MQESGKRKKEITPSTMDEQGAAAVEYALIAGLIAAVLIPALTALGQRISEVFQTLSTALTV